MKDDIRLRRRAVGEYRISLCAAKHEHAIAGADGRSHRIAMRRVDLRRIIGQREGHGNLASFGIDESFGNGLRRHVGHRGIQKQNVDDSVGRKRHALAIGNRAGELAAGCLGGGKGRCGEQRQKANEQADARKPKYHDVLIKTGHKVNMLARVVPPRGTQH